MKIYATICATAALAAGLISVSPAAKAQEPMPAAQQNALVQQYCAVCHTDASRNGGLSLQHFDAGQVDPGLAAMLVSKLKGGALGAAGLPLPDSATQQALQSALTAEAQGAGTWAFHRTQDPATAAPVLIASVVQEVKTGAEPDLYWLTLTCREDTHETELQLAWAPGVPQAGRSISVAVDGKPPVTYTVDGIEKMGNGQDGISGPGAAKLATALPERTLTVSNLFGNEKVVFPFSELNPKTRQALSECVAKPGAGR